MATGIPAMANAGAGTLPALMPSSAAAMAISAPPPNIASMRDSLAVLPCLRSSTLVSAKNKPPAKASQSAMLLGTGQGDVGDFKTTSTPTSANSRRSSEPVVGFSPNMAQAISTDHAGIR